MTTRRSTPGEMGVMIAIGIGVAGALWALAWVATQTPETRTAERDGQSHAAQKHDEAGAGAVNRYHDAHLSGRAPACRHLPPSPVDASPSIAPIRLASMTEPERVIWSSREDRGGQHESASSAGRSPMARPCARSAGAWALTSFRRAAAMSAEPRVAAASSQ